ncbi:LysM receptor kinase K1B, partial [Trifolium medium]|nr:LysM receptor kinase K1B [Trifolium medium]
YDSMADFTLSNMTTEDWLDEWTERNSVNVTVNCSCGNISKDYGRFPRIMVCSSHTLFILRELWSLLQRIPSWMLSC